MEKKKLKNIIKLGIAAVIFAVIYNSINLYDERRMLESKGLITSAAESGQYIPANLDYTEVINSVKKEEGIKTETLKTTVKKPEFQETVSKTDNLSAEQLLLNADSLVEDALSEENEEMRMQHFRDALDLYKEALKKDEESLKAMLGAGSMATFIGKKTEARNILMRAYATYPENPSVHKALGDYSFRFSEFNNAIEYYNLSLSSGNLMDYGTNIATAACYEKLGDKEKAVTYYKVALSLEPDSEIAKQRLAVYEGLERQGYSPDSRVQEAQNESEDNSLTEEQIEKLIIKTHKIK